jgi:hypothetical protein
MVVTQAHALVSGLVTHDADPAADEEALSRLALWALRHYSPVIAADPPAGIATWIRSWVSLQAQSRERSRRVAFGR